MKQTNPFIVVKTNPKIKKWVTTQAKKNKVTQAYFINNMLSVAMGNVSKKTKSTKASA